MNSIRVTRLSRLSMSILLLGLLETTSSAQGQGVGKPDRKAESPSVKGQDPGKNAGKPKVPTSGPARQSAPKPISFMRDVAPMMVRNCIACHNPKKSEGKYVMTTFTQLAKGGKQGQGMNLVPGKPDESYFIDLLLPDAQPRMPYKQDPLPQEDIATLRRWVEEGAKYDGLTPGEDWTFLLRKTQVVNVPEIYPVPVPVTAIAITPDSGLIASSGYHEVTFWNSKDGTLGRRLGGLPERVYDLTYSADGKWLLASSGDPGQYGIARLWAVGMSGSLTHVRDLAESQDVVFAAAFSPDGKRLATAGADRIIRIYDTETGKIFAQIEDHADWIFDIAFSPDGKRLASASRDKTSKVFDVEKKESLVTFPGHAQPVYSVSFTPDGKAIATGGEDNQVRIWTADGEAKQIRTIGGFGGAVFKLLYTPDGGQLIAAGADKVVRIFKSDNGTQVRTLAGQGDWIYSLAISRDSKILASGSWDGQIRLWSLSDGKLQRTILAAPGLKIAGSPPRN